LTANSPTFAGLEYWNAGMLGLTDEGLFEISVLNKKRRFSELTPINPSFHYSIHEVVESDFGWSANSTKPYDFIVQPEDAVNPANSVKTAR